MDIPERFPKIMAPFHRGSTPHSFVNPNPDERFAWVFEDNDVEIVEKLHGTNVAVKMEHGNVVGAATRMGTREMNELNPFGSENHQIITRGIQNSINSNFLYMHNNGWVFGELVGPNFHGNPYELEEHLFVPFDWIREHCQYNDLPDELTYESLKEWFNSRICSHFTARLQGQSSSETTVSDGYFVEGVVFIHPSYRGTIAYSNMETFKTDNYDEVATQFAKLRRDMFEDIYVEHNFGRFNL